MNGDAMDKKLYAHEVGRYKRKVERLEAELESKLETIEMWRKSYQLLRGVVTLLVEELGTVVIHKDDLDEAVRGVEECHIEWDDEALTYTLRPFDPDEDE